MEIILAYPTGQCSECKRTATLYYKGICGACYQRQRYRNMPPSTCHPERKAHVGGLCKQCYRNGERAQRAPCHPDRPIAARGLCIECYRNLPEVKEQATRKRRLRKYGLTQEQYDEIGNVQGWSCYVCEGEVEAIDHCHESGNVRGILCTKCNQGLGHFKDNSNLMRKAAAYLDERKNGFSARNDWIQTISGKAVFPMHPREEEIDIEDIAHALSRLCRYAGHTKEFYSVAEHSYLLSHAVPSEYALQALLHDATEAYIVDIPRPIKQHITGYKSMEENLCKVIFAKYGVPYPLPKTVMEYDIAICRDERDQVMAKPPMPWAENDPLGVTIQCWSPSIAKQMFLMRFHELYDGE